ncbi:MAG: tetratricopeptide repeat protein [Candidatus Nealsonbacteria bacterium]|nr:tetratricopeptide repeat protein [Candidatus Nealsonbacteria bacterium]
MGTGQKPRLARCAEAFLPRRFALLVVFFATIVAHGTSAPVEAADPPPATPPTSTRPLEKALAGFNRGAALMEQYQYVDAAKAFEAVVEAAPDWTAARFNLGLAYFNMHGARGAQQNLATARDTFLDVLESDPKHLHAAFCLGLYHQHVGENEKRAIAIGANSPFGRDT